jgi:hypothetical protein
MADRERLDRPGYYRIRVRGTLTPDWSDWFESLALSASEDEIGPIVTLCGYLPDQAALQGVLSKLVNLNLQLLGMELLDPGSET